jgi:hypothetical protein
MLWISSSAVSTVIFHFSGRDIFEFVAVESYMNRHQSMVVEYEQCVGSMWVCSPCWPSAEPSHQELPDGDLIQIYQVIGSRNGKHALPFC